MPKKPYSETMRSFELARIRSIDMILAFSKKLELEPGQRAIITGDLAIDLNLDDKFWETQIAYNFLPLKPLRIESKRASSSYERVAAPCSPKDFIEKTLTAIIEYSKFLKSPQILTDAIERLERAYGELLDSLKPKVTTCIPKIFGKKDDISKILT